MEFAQPPPNMGAPPPNMHLPPPNLSEPPPNLLMPPPNMNAMGNPMGPPPNSYNQRMDYKQFNAPRHHFRPFLNLARPLPGILGNMTLEDFDGKRLRKSVMRKTVDYNSSIIKALENRVWQRDFRDRRALQPDVMYYPDMMPPPSYPDNPINCVTTRFVKTATNKMRCPIFCMAWTPEGRRLVTGASSGEFTLWNGLTFNFETILQAHDSPVRTMVWSHNDSWMVTGDHAGYVKYWQSNMNNVKMFQAHKEALRGISFSPTDSKFVTCSDDGTLRIWDFFRYQEERILRGHGADVKCVHWHPQKGLIISGSKDNQQPIKLWDPKTGQSLATLHAHKSTVMDLKWNDNGNWLITASRDHLLKLFDLRNLSQEVQTFRGHKKEASSVAWHPHHEGLFCSGGSDGSIMFWHVGADKEVGAIEQAHDSIVWTLAWHPLGHILCSGSNDHTSKFWTRNRPGDQMRDKYNLNTLPPGITGLDDVDIDEPSVIPGMGPEDKVEPLILSDGNMEIPGLDLDAVVNSNEEKAKAKKVPYSKPIPRNFQAQWNETGDEESALSEVISQIVENTPGVVPLQKITPNAIIVYGKLIPVEPGSKLEAAIAEGPDALQKFIDSGQIEELHDVMPHGDEHDYLNDAYMDDDDEEEQAASIESQQQPPLQINNKPEPTSVWDPPKSEPEIRPPFPNDGRGMDMDSRSRPDMDSRNRQDVDSRNRPDIDSRGRPDMDSRSRQDVDFRNQGDYSYNNSDDYRNTRYEEEPEDDYDYQDRSYQRERNGNFNNQFNRNGGSNFNNNFRGNNNFNNRGDYRSDNSNRGPPNNDNFRSRVNRPPPNRPQRSGNSGPRGRPMPHRGRGGLPPQNPRNNSGNNSGGNNNRGQPNRGRMY